MSFSEISSQYLNPAIIIFIMFALGLTLTLQAFRNVILYPKAVMVGLVGQMIFLPLVAFAVTFMVPMPAAVKIGLIIIAACPGGVTSNAIVFALKGEVALSVTLTAISSILTVFTIPFLIGLGMDLHLEAGQVVEIPALEMIQRLFMMAAAPIFAGMAVRALVPELVLRSMGWVRRVATTLLIGIIIVNFIEPFEVIKAHLDRIFGAALILGVIVVFGGYLAATMMKLERPKSVAIAVEIGTQNVPMAILIGSTLLAWPALNAAPIIYGTINWILIAMVITLLHFRHRRQMG